SAGVAYQVVLPAIRCNEEKARVNAATMIRDRARSSYDQPRRARRPAAAFIRCLKSFPNDAEFLTLLASNQHVLGIHDESERNYRRALELNERAETYAFLALLQ